ncbi:DUF6368 family protein [Aquipseudomonas alcaligenes]|uniref:DUF6368 family protein n=1 Tax=Aquipseudomonas alcaligenes TaxID=43263 RepID=UPI001658CCE2|nr:DUF6368 family protein [Pseudomonas alcaligenes]
MAGPTAAILFKQHTNDVFLAEVKDLIEKNAEEVRGHNFWSDGMPFIFSLEWEWEGEKESYSELKRFTAWCPESQLVLAAMCNGDEDHIKLGELCALFATKLSGVVYFGLPLSQYTSDESILCHQEHFILDDTSLMGAQLMKKWLSHPDFRMVK